MKILVVGSGGREHTLIWKIKQSKCPLKIYALPGNGGIGEIAECIKIKPEDINRILEFAQEIKPDLTLIGPEAPLSMGIVDEFKKRGFKIFGPTQKASQIESSKIFAKELMRKYNIPSPDFTTFDNPNAAKFYIEKKSCPLVIKADGLAAGKGVMVTSQKEEALSFVEKIMEEKIFGKSGERIIIEECLYGEEFSFMCFADGERVLPMVQAQDYKRVFDNDEGPNTGGMGCYSPVPIVSKEVYDFSLEKIIIPTLKALKKEDILYQGVLYGGLILTAKGPKVLEFNCRFGDPETQVVLPRMKTDLIEVIEGVIKGELEKVKIEWSEDVAVCVVTASRGYPGDYEKGKVITGLEEVDKLDKVLIFHAGTDKINGKWTTTGGRVLGVTALGCDFNDAINIVYNAVGKINFEGMHYRKDIGQRALKHFR